MTTPLPSALIANPRLSRWIAFDTPGVVEIRSGKVEIGQGIGTALLQIAADALGLPMDRLRLVAGDTALGPDEGWTSASISIEQGGAAIERLCCVVRELFTAAAATQLDVAPRDLIVADGRFVDPASGASVDYWTLASRVALDRDIDATMPASALTARHHVGAPAPRHDLATKLRGGGFIHDMVVPAMLHARIVRPPGPGATLLSIDRAAIAALPGVTALVVDGSLVGVVARREEQAIEAAEKAQRRCAWSAAAPLPDPLDGPAGLRTSSVETRIVARSVGQAAQGSNHRATYSRPYLAHASIGLVCAIARWDAGTLTVWSQTQGVFPLRDNLARLFDLRPDRVRVIHRDGAGCYGHNGADDVAAEAAILARATGQPVRLVWSRAEELGWAPFGSAMCIDVTATLGDDGRIAAWQQEIWSATHLTRPGWGDGVNLLAAGMIAEPMAASATADPGQSPWGGGGDRNAIPIYAVGCCDVVYNLALTAPLRTSALRSLGAFANVFAIESFMDELAALSATDPVVFRLRHLEADPRGCDVLAAAAELAGWDSAALGTGADGRGIGFARYKNKGAWCAVVAEVRIDERVRVKRVWAAVDAGRLINPDGVRNQVQGGIIQAISWTLKERVAWNESGLLMRGWDDYPILGFDDVPEIGLVLLDRPGEPSLGVGECAAGPTAAAIANAITHAMAVRVRDLPLTGDRIIAAMQL